jgi:hypothetical protein
MIQAREDQKGSLSPCDNLPVVGERCKYAYVHIVVCLTADC